MRKQKFLALLLALVMVLSLVPVTAFADGDTTTEGLVMSKTATLENDGTYTINLSAYSTGSTTTQSIKAGVPLDIVIILDQSGSMAYSLNSSNYATSEENTRYYKLRQEVEKFVNSIADNAKEYGVDHRVSLVGFANGNSSGTSNGSLCHTSADSNSTYWMNTGIFIDGKLKNYGANSNGSSHQLTESDYQKTLVTIPSTGVVPTALSSAYANIAANGGTYTEYGLTMAANVFQYNAQREYTDKDGNTAKSQRVVILFTDGDSNSEDDTNLGGAYTLKNTYGAKVYTVSMLSSENEVLDYMSSNYPTISKLSDAQTTTTYEKVYDLSTDETYYVKKTILFWTYYDVQYGSYDIETYGYTALSGGLDSLDTSMKYYIEQNGSYTEITYYFDAWRYGLATEVDSDATIYERYVASSTTYTGWYYEDGWGNRTIYTPMANSSDTSNTQFYKKIVTGGIAASDTKYYTNISNMSNLGDIFTNIVEDVTSSSTSVTLNASSYMLDVLADGFVLPGDFETNISKYVTIKTYSDTSATTEVTNTLTPEAYKVDGVVKGVKVSGFDYSTKYFATGNTGEMLTVKITGILPTDDAVTNTVIDTNDATSGIHGTDASGNEVNFPFEQPKTILTSKTYVVDYAKPFSVSASDWKQSSASAYVDTFRAITSSDGTALDLNYGKIDGTTYTPQTTNWDGYDNIYVFGTTEDETVLSASANAVYSKLWSKVSVIPANNVYYEDTFKDTTATEGAAGTVGIVYTGSWKEGTAGSNTEDANGSIAGWVEDLSDDTGYSDGSAYEVSYDGSNAATAKFTFTGTGVDIYSRTNLDSGKVFAFLRQVGEDGTVTNKQMLLVDNLAVSGDYYNVPTLTFQDLPYGTYSVEIVVNRAYAVDANGDIIDEETYRSTYYLDGIRVYNPLGSASDDDTKIDEVVNEAYNGQIETAFKEVRDLLVNADNTADTTNTGNAVFIDHNLDEDEVAYKAVVYEETDVYNNYGPKNEVYLAPGQSIVFAVEGADNYYIGLKSLKGTVATVNAVFSYGEGNSVASISHTTDLYYKVVPSTVDGVNYITVSNTTEVAEGGEEPILAVTKLQMTSGVVGQVMSLRAISDEEAVAEVAAFSLRSTAAYSAEPEEETPEETTPEETTPEETPSEPEVPDIDVEIENPEPTPEQKPAQNEALKNLVKNLFNKILGWFGR